ncbi:hypothetical protein [Natrinema sp. SYSU A 869]|uniref:hypothetical protein n=1 Tax=Natrinema sp. SYSU A 869 TaxID=2871694 RepID=UPI001CA409A7|nr:hypothetical protein [Natrinema sp. SYSU A 869]
MTDRARSADEDGVEFTHNETGGSSTDDDTDPARDVSDQPEPLADLAATVEGTDDADRSRLSAPDFDDLFDRQDSTEIDGDRLWERLEADDPDAALSPDGPGAASAPDDRETHEIDKRSYCQGCDHFADPPAVACDHEDAEILAVPTMTTFRVADCPFILDESLEGEDDSSH